MSSRWFHGYRVGQRVEVRIDTMLAGKCWHPGVVKRKSRAGHPDVAVDGVSELIAIDRKGDIRPVRTLPEVSR